MTPTTIYDCFFFTIANASVIADLAGQTNTSFHTMTVCFVNYILPDKSKHRFSSITFGHPCTLTLYDQYELNELVISYLCTQNFSISFVIHVCIERNVRN